VEFRARLLETLRAMQAVLDEPGVLVVGSEVPNFLEEDAASTLVVSQDIDLGVPVSSHARVKELLRSVRGLHRSEEEPSVWVPDSSALIEVNFVGIDPAIHDASETYVLEDDELPLLVFGQLSLLRPGDRVEVEGVRIPLPRKAGLLLEKLVTDRSGEKGDRDRLVVLGLLLVSNDTDRAELVREVRALSAELRHAVRSNLTMLSLMRPIVGMPDPEAHRARIHQLLATLPQEED
jgi:hypothetical protein